MVLLCFGFANTAAAARSQTKGYIGVVGDFTVANCDRVLPTRSIGGACFNVQPGETSVAVTISDRTGRDVGGQIMFRDAAGEDLLPEYVIFCSSSGRIPIPLRATRLFVYVDTIFAIIDCEDASAIATIGTITASFA